MSNFTPRIKNTFDFEGDTIKVVMSRLRRKHMVVLMPFMSQDGLALEFTDVPAFLEAAAEVLSDCIVSFNGLTDADGTSITQESDLFEEEVLGGLYFMGLVQEMMGALLEASFIGEADEEK